MIFDGEDEATLAHYGILRRSGRYPWGSGGNSSGEHSYRTFLEAVDSMRKQGLTEAQIAEGLGVTTTQLRAGKSIAKNQQRQADIAMAQRLKDKGYSNSAIGRQMKINESSVRALLAPGQKDKADVLHGTTSFLKDQVAAKGYVDVGAHVERHMTISRTKLDTAIEVLRNEGYEVHNVQVDQLGTSQKTTIKVLAPPGTTYREIATNTDKIQSIQGYSQDGGRSFNPIHPPLSVSSKRLAIRYADQGGADADGVIYVRPGVADVSLGGNRYAQVRIAIDGTHFIKGMAVYKDDMPPGVDLMFNTNKKDTGNKHDALKPIKDDPDLPFGAIVRQITAMNPDGTTRVTSSMNIVNDDSDWEKWSRTLSSQMLSKQKPSLAKAQLDMLHESRKAELDSIMAMTNPAVRQKLLEEFADSTDAAAVHLKAAALPRQKTHVILPVNSLRDNEVYAPNFDNGEHVVLVRFPHGGIFEIPQLTVNNRNPEAKKLLGTEPRNAIGINSKVAQRLSGADFDGDTVLVIPNNKGLIKTEPALEGLKGFDPQAAFPGYPGMAKMSARTKQIQMGVVSNLITDMTIQGAHAAELARAVRHSMVVIDAEKHGLNYKQSAIDNGIPQLMERYQGKKAGGASTLISRKKSEEHVPEIKPRSAKKGGPVDRVTGKKVFEQTGESFIDKRTGKLVVKTTKVRKLEMTDDAHTLVSDNGGTKIERIYADHSNRMKGLAAQARRAAVNTKTTPYSPSARTAYASEVATLNAKLDIALRNAPLERIAQVIANAGVSQKRRANPDMEKSELKKVKAQELTKARIRTGAKKTRITITDAEWKAIQAGAISQSKLSQILDNADMVVVRQHASPKVPLLMTSAKKHRAQAMFASGYTQAEVAQALGVSLTTLKDSLRE